MVMSERCYQRGRVKQSETGWAIIQVAIHFSYDYCACYNEGVALERELTKEYGGTQDTVGEGLKVDFTPWSSRFTSLDSQGNQTFKSTEALRFIFYFHQMQELHARNAALELLLENHLIY